MNNFCGEEGCESNLPHRHGDELPWYSISVEGWKAVVRMNLEYKLMFGAGKYYYPSKGRKKNNRRIKKANRRAASSAKRMLRERNPLLKVASETCLFTVTSKLP
jgi:hypothetical protein